MRIANKCILSLFFLYVMKRALLCLALVGTVLLGMAAQLPAQTNEEIINAGPWTTYQVGEGVIVKTCHFANLFGGQQDVYVTDADMNVAGVSLVMTGDGTGTRKTVSGWASSVTGTAAAINGAWANPSTGIPDQFLRINGVNLATTNPVAQERGGIVVASNGQVTCRTLPAGGWGSLPDPNIMASEVASVDNGNAFVWSVSAPGTGDYNYYYVNRAPRSAIGVTANNHVLLVVVDGRRAPAAIGVTYAHVAELLMALGAVNGTELDGGGSSTLWGRDHAVFNQPSDGSQRSVAMALCVVAPTVETPYNSEFVGATYANTMMSGGSQIVTMEFKNTGTNAWDAGTHLGTTSPRDRSSVFESPGWLSAQRPCSTVEGTVAPDSTGHFTFEVVAPVVVSPQTYFEAFGLVQEGVTWFGPEQNTLTLTVLPPGQVAVDEIIIESRPGGLNYAWYSETGGWADSGTNCTATGLTAGIGMRYGSTFSSVAGLKVATFRPVIVVPGDYEIFAAWGAGTNRRSPISYLVTGADGAAETHLDQSATANEWITLGIHALAAGSGGSVQMSNKDVNVSGSVYTAGVRFVFQQPPPTPGPSVLEVLLGNRVSVPQDDHNSDGVVDGADLVTD
ncbi:hypothetical protein BH09SUM1_BH09SUM1_16930 [soil metagenome]